MRTITLEEHFAIPGFAEEASLSFLDEARLSGGRTAETVRRLHDLGDGRIAEMDAAGIDVQVLTFTSPGPDQLDAKEATELARRANDVAAEAVARHPSRFAALASVPVAAPEQAAAELEFRVRQQGFKGAVINGHHRGRYLDDRFFDPLLARLEALGVPVYLHPTQPPRPVIDTYYGGFAPKVVEVLSMAGWGWHIETAVHVIRLILGGVFDRHPGLQVIIGHLGEALPFMESRLDVMPPSLTGLQRPISSYLHENVYYTFSGFNFTATFLDLFLHVGADRILFSADYPYTSMAEARAFLDRLPVSPADRERIAHGNAERLLRM
jgi:predicted TIM-barrel fold metal-dependent hydrolase